MAAAAAATRRATAPARTRARNRPRRAPARRARPAPRARQAQAARMMKPAMAGAAMLPHAAVRSAGAVRDLSDSGLIVRLTRGRGWIAVLSALLGGIVALNVLSLSLNAGSGRLSLQIEELQTENSALRAETEQRLSANRVEAEAARLGLAVPDPKQITYLSAASGDAARLVHLLDTNSFLTAPSQPSSYPTGQTSSSASPGSTGQTSQTSPPRTSTTAPSPASGTGSSGGGSSGSGAPSGASGGTTGGVGL